MNSSDYGQVVSAKDTALLQDEMLPQNGTNSEVDELSIGAALNPLWFYHKEGTINGVPVADEDRDLPILSDAQLMSAFELNRTSKSVVLWLSPHEKEYNELYNRILAMQDKGAAVVTEETKQYDQTKSMFMVWVKYTELKYKLHPRYNYLKEGSHDKTK